MNLEEMEAYLLERLAYVMKSERASAEDVLRCMEVLAQVRQSQHLEYISMKIDDIARDMSAVQLSNLGQ